ncbi:unnamed protein product [Cylicocyclus nassatus]|uniref:SGNH hydrolase-type esterase domain-containing protein n=1 Tax=Cylicocyclus nassatus TaxID=53992 RepID=A0AA36DMY3_CYLNA|nr:unnamed protein product [Cylicocyclus nassatus]
MVLGTSFFYFFQMLNNWPRVLMFIWENSRASQITQMVIDVEILSSSLNLHHNRLINSPTDFEQFYGLKNISSCVFSAPPNATYHWQHFFEGEKLSNLQTKTCYVTLRCVKEGTHTVHLSVTNSRGEIISAGSKTFESHPRWVAIVGDSFASGEGNPDVQQREDHRAQWLDGRCHRSGKSFAAQVFREIQSVKQDLYLTYLACAGATVESGLLKVKGQLSQLDVLESISTMRGRGPDIAILTAGGNDIGFSDIINSLLHESSKAVVGLLDMRFFFVSHLLDNVAERFNALGARNIFVPQYFDFTKNERGEVDASCLAYGEMTTSSMMFAERAILRRLNQLLLKKGAQHGWRVASTIPGLFARAGICSSHSFIRTREESLALQGDPFGAFHPSEEGHRAVAEELIKLLKKSGTLESLLQ